MIDVAWVTCRRLPEPDPDEKPALEALRAAGLQVEKLAWDDPEAKDPESFSLTVLRSCWNYYEDPDAFLSWLERTGERSRLENPSSIARWNLHKSYLESLEQGGIPIVPTIWLERGTRIDLSASLRKHGWQDVVIKPQVSAASFSTRRFRPSGEAQRFLDEQLAERDMLVQVYVPSVETTGERALVWIDGEFTHAVVKKPRFAGDDESVSGAVRVGGGEAGLGATTLAAAARSGGFGVDDLLYARVDTVEHRGRRVVSELELLEPSLFLLEHPAALERFVSGVVRRLRNP